MLAREILDLAGIGIILAKQRTTKVLIRLRRCVDWSAPLLFAYAINRFSHDMAHFIFNAFKCLVTFCIPNCFKSIYLHFPLTFLRWTILDQLASYTDEWQLIMLSNITDKRKSWLVKRYVGLRSSLMATAVWLNKLVNKFNVPHMFFFCTFYTEPPQLIHSNDLKIKCKYKS